MLALLSFCFPCFILYAMMTAIQRTVEIAENRRLVLDIPEEIPTGKTEMTIVFSPLPPETGQGTQRHKNAIDKARGIAKRLGAGLSVDTFLRWKQDELALEETQYRTRVNAKDVT